MPMWCVAPLEMNEGNSLGVRVQSAYRLQCRNSRTCELYCNGHLQNEHLALPLACSCWYRSVGVCLSVSHSDALEIYRSTSKREAERQLIG